MERGLQGQFLPRTTAPEPFQAFLPAPLPPQPGLQLDFRLQDLLGRANRALGRLDGITNLLPEPSLFLYFYVRKEALLSSQIEGTQSSLSDLLLFESEEVPGVPLDDVQEVSNYVAALDRGLELLRTKLPVSLRLHPRDPQGPARSGTWLATRSPASSAGRRTGLEAPGPGMPCSSLHRRKRSWGVWARWRSSCTTNRCPHRCSSRPRSRTCSSRPSTRSWTATAAWADC